MPSLSHILSKTKKVFQDNEDLEARWLAHLQVWLKDTTAIKDLLSWFLVRAVCTPHSPFPTSQGWSLFAESQQRPGVLSWHRKFITAYCYTRQILHTQGVSRANAPGRTLSLPGQWQKINCFWPVAHTFSNTSNHLLARLLHTVLRANPTAVFFSKMEALSPAFLGHPPPGDPRWQQICSACVYTQRVFSCPTLHCLLK